jgi:hypothetical protein
MARSFSALLSQRIRKKNTPTGVNNIAMLLAGVILLSNTLMPANAIAASFALVTENPPQPVFTSITDSTGSFTRLGDFSETFRNDSSTPFTRFDMSFINASGVSANWVHPSGTVSPFDQGSGSFSPFTNPPLQVQTFQAVNSPGVLIGSFFRIETQGFNTLGLGGAPTLVTFVPPTIPEPSTWLLFASGFAALLFFRKRFSS